MITVLEAAGLRDANLTGADTVHAYGVGLGSGAQEAPNWDRRPTVRKPCQVASDCAFQGGGPPATQTDCHIVCSPETHLCPAASVGVSARNLADCTQGDGTLGLCCNGSCDGLADICLACE